MDKEGDRGGLDPLKLGDRSISAEEIENLEVWSSISPAPPEREGGRGKSMRSIARDLFSI